MWYRKKFDEILIFFSIMYLNFILFFIIIEFFY